MNGKKRVEDLHAIWLLQLKAMALAMWKEQKERRWKIEHLAEWSAAASSQTISKFPNGSLRYLEFVLSLTDSQRTSTAHSRFWALRGVVRAHPNCSFALLWRQAWSPRAAQIGYLKNAYEAATAITERRTKLSSTPTKNFSEKTGKILSTLCQGLLGSRWRWLS